MIVPVTAIYAAVIALMMLALAYRVTGFRRRDSIGMGEHGSRDLQVAVRSHANLVEYAPIFVLLLFIGEINGVTVDWLHAAGLLFVLSRFAHAWGMTASSGRAHPGRLVGILGTWIAMVIMVVLVIWNLALFRF
jgi:uncharacterized membrane protein YecN with MAPEG domain